MSPTEKGRYCGHCQTEVVNFSGWKDAEIASYVLNSKKKVCGMLGAPPMAAQVPSASASRFRLLAVLSMTSVLGLAYAKSPGAELQTFPQMPYRTETSQEGVIAISRADSLIIKGRVIETTEAGVNFLPGVRIYIKGDTRFASTDKDGFFELKIARNKQKTLELRISFIGFKTETIQVRVRRRQIFDIGTIKISADAGMLGEVIIVRPKKN